MRRTSSRFGARLEPFGHVDLQLARGRTLDIVTQVESLRSYGAQLVGDYSAYTAGRAMLEAAERLVDRGRRAGRAAVPPAGRRAARDDRPGRASPAQVLDAFLLRSLAVAGLRAVVRRVRAVRRSPGPHVAFNPSAGGVLCADCRLPGSARPAVGDRPRCWGRCSPATGRPSTPPTQRHLREASGLVAGYVAWHLERGLTSLSHVAR